MFKITKEFHCSAGHYLQGLSQEHPCSTQHGHNYIIKVELKSEKLNDVGFIKDYRDLDCIKTWIDSNMDHKNLNNVFPFNPTAENMARDLAVRFRLMVKEISAVEISETPKTWARYEFED